MEAQNFNETRWPRFDERQAVEIRYLREKMQKAEQENEGLKKKVADRDAVIKALNTKHQKMCYLNNETMEVQREYEASLLQIILGTEQQTGRRPNWTLNDLDNSDENVYVQIQDTRDANNSPTISSRETETEADRHARSPTAVFSPAAHGTQLNEDRNLQMADGDQNPSTMPGPVESLGYHHRQVQVIGDFSSSIGTMSSNEEFQPLSFSDIPTDSSSSSEESSGLRKKFVRAWRKTLKKESYDTKL